MAKRLSASDWSAIKIQYELGHPIRAIAREFNITHGAIQSKIKKENWEQSLAIKVTDVKEKIKEISQVATSEQMVAIEQEISDTLQIMKSITNLQKGALNIHNIAIKNTLRKIQSGELSENEALRNVSMSGLSVDKIFAQVAPQQPSTAIQINNESDERNVVINLVEYKNGDRD